MVTSRRAVAITVIACVTPVVSHSIGRSVYGLLLPAIKADLEITNSQAGWPSSGIFILYVVGVIAVVLAAPRLEPVTIMRTALTLSVIGLIISSTAQSLVQLSIGVSLVGGAGAGIWMTAPVLATHYVSPKRRGLVIGALMSTIGLSNVAFGAGTSVARRLTGNADLWRPVWVVAFAFTAAALIGMVVVSRFPKTDRIGSAGIGMQHLRSIPHWRNVTLAYALFGGMSAGFGTFIVAALEDHGDVATSSSPIVFSAMGIAGMLAAPVAGALSDRVGRVAVLRLTLVALFIANAAVVVGGPGPTIFGALLYSAGAGTFPATIATYVRDSLDNRSFSQALALMTILFSVMAAIMPLVVGRIADSSFGWAYAVLTVMPAVSLLLLAPISTVPRPERAARA